MRFPAFATNLLFFAAVAAVRAGTIETFTGDILTGKVDLDYGGVMFHPVNGPASKIDLSTIYRVEFNSTASIEEYQPGVVLRSGVRLAAPWGPFNDPVVKFPRRNLTVPAEEIAWIVYERFPAELAANVPGGQTGVLLPKGDFFGGTIKGADAEAAKVSNPVFGPRTFAARDMFALVLRSTHVPAAQYEVRTMDGSLFAADGLSPDRSSVAIKHLLYDHLVLNPAEIIDIRAGANRCRPLASLAELHAEPADGLNLLADRGFMLATKSVISCVVPAGFTEFAAKVAPDENSPPGTKLVFSVFADGRSLAHTTPIGLGELPQNLHVSLPECRNLILRVDAPGQPGFSAVRGHWIQAFFLRR